jgi:hypothetical protein
MIRIVIRFINIVIVLAAHAAARMGVRTLLVRSYVT